MDILALLREFTSSGISDIALLVVIPLLVRYWISESRSELRQDFNDAMDAKLHDNNEVMNARFDQLERRMDQFERRMDQLDRKLDQHDRKNESRAYDIMQHLMDLREQLANIEGRLGISPPRRGLETPMPTPAAAP